jgi:hypothetical protein
LPWETLAAFLTKIHSPGLLFKTKAAQYTLLNIADNTLGLAPDYNISAMEMWFSVLKVFIRTRKHLIPFTNPFYFAPLGGGGQTKVPSLVKLLTANDPLALISRLNIDNNIVEILVHARHYAF